MQPPSLCIVDYQLGFGCIFNVHRFEAWLKDKKAKAEAELMRKKAKSGLFLCGSCEFARFLILKHLAELPWTSTLVLGRGC